LEKTVLVYRRPDEMTIAERIPVEPVTGVLLVGGASRRFGSPKAVARLASGETLAERMWSLLAWCDERVAVGKGGESLPFPVLADGRAVAAPIAGVVAGLRAARNDLCVVLPVDLPALQPDDLRALAAACVDAAVPPTGPLPGAYRRTAALPAFEAALGAGRLSLREAIAGLDIAVVPVAPSHLVNVNTPAELTRVQECAPERPSG
jgi:molybdopterin-guanine dinucleotide biosynthesis protein A